MDKNVPENLIEFVIGLHTVEIIKARMNDNSEEWFDAWIDGEPKLFNEPNLENLLRQVWQQLGNRKLEV